VFISFHGILLLGDAYLKPTLSQLLTPFALLNYRPVGVGFGQLVFYMWVILVLSFYLKKIIGRRVWRGLHYIGFAVFFTAMVHGITSGSDSAQVWMQVIYWFSAASVLFLSAFRIAMRFTTVKHPAGYEKA
jgi:methionine sulfoxide reductase heme-binding subunit